MTEGIIGAAISVHRELGPGLLESVYETCLAAELIERGIKVERQVPMPVSYKGERLECGFRVDLLVEGIVIVELKSIANLEPVHTAQLLTYLRLSRCRIGFLINFNVRLLRDGIRRFVYDPPDSPPRPQC